MTLSAVQESDRVDIEDLLQPSLAARYGRISVPVFEIPEDSMPKEAAYQIIHDELMLDGNPRLELGSVVATWMEPECDKLIMASLNKNYADLDFYPVTTELQNRCVNMIARLFHAPLGKKPDTATWVGTAPLRKPNTATGVGTAPLGKKPDAATGVRTAPHGKKPGTATGVGTVGSSEAIMLAGLAFKRRWQNKMKAAGKAYDKPNIVAGANVHVCWKKFAKYFEVELKEVKLRKDYFVMDPDEAIKLVDENTICVVAILGSTLTGEFENVGRLNNLLNDNNKKYKTWDTPIHVDAASGGFIAPFLYPDREWDFRLKWVHSINVSGHKYGFVYPGMGWVIWKKKKYLPEELIFHINYLGDDQETFTLNFSKGSTQIIAQYYNLIRLGFEGYKKIMITCQGNAMFLKGRLESTKHFNIVSKDDGVPLVAFSLKDRRRYNEYEISHMLKRFGWAVPAYEMPPNAQKITVLRAVIREDVSRVMIDQFVNDIMKVLKELSELKNNPTIASRRRTNGVC